MQARSLPCRDWELFLSDHEEVATLLGAQPSWLLI